MQISLYNAWFLSVPMIVIFAYVALFHRETAKRMGDTSGYTSKEKAAAFSASLSPYPFMILTIFTPILSNGAALAIGVFLYGVGLSGFLLSVVMYTKTIPGQLTTDGIYKISRNPMYVSALVIFASIVIMTLNILLLVLLVVIIVLHHQMILAEEKACAKRFGKTYELYMQITPRYLLI